MRLLLCKSYEMSPSARASKGQEVTEMRLGKGKILGLGAGSGVHRRASAAGRSGGARHGAGGLAAASATGGGIAAAA